MMVALVMVMVLGIGICENREGQCDDITNGKGGVEGHVAWEVALGRVVGRMPPLHAQFPIYLNRMMAWLYLGPKLYL